MRVTRYVWINNLPPRVNEQDIRDILQSHGKIQSVRIHEQDGNRGTVVAFVDTKSATKAVENTVKLKKVVLHLQYCESSGIPGNSVDHTSASVDFSHANSNSVFHSDDSYSMPKSQSISSISNTSPVLEDADQKDNVNSSLHYAFPTSKGMDLNSTRLSGERRGLKISHLPLRSSDTNLREGLFHEYKKHGKITSVYVKGQGEERLCIITFKKSEDAQKAYLSSKGKVFFGTAISVSLHEGLDSEDPDLCPPEHALDEYHPKATKTLFVGNLCSATITQDELRKTFRIYGEIDIKIQTNQPGTSYAFIQYSDIKSVVRALSDQEFIRVNNKIVKLGFGKSQPSNVVWLDNLASAINETYLTKQFGRYGQLNHVVLDRKSFKALLYFETVEMAQRAVNETRNRAIIGRKVQIDFAGYECQVAFMKKLAKHDNFGQVYENYKERLQELLSLWPSYGGVLPFLNDRAKYFQETQRNNSLSSTNTKFSYRKSNCISSSPNERISRRDQSEVKGRGSTPVSPYNRPHHNFSYLDRKRTFLTNSPDGSKSSHTNRSNVKTESSSSISDNKFYKKYNNFDGSTTKGRFVNQSGINKYNELRQHSEYTNVRSKSYLLDEADEISSGSFSSDFSVDGSPDGFAKRCSSDSSDYGLIPKSMSYSSRNKQREDNVHCKNKKDDFASAGRKKLHKNSDSSSPQARLLLSYNSHSRTSANMDYNRNSSNSGHRHSRDRYGETVDRHTKTSSQNVHKHLSKNADFEYSSHTKNKLGSYSHSSSIPKDSESGVPRLNVFPTSPVSSEDLNYDKKQEGNKNHDDCHKSHDALTKLELERAKLLRELSLLNSEVIGGSRGKLPSSDVRHSKKRSSSNALESSILSPKAKYESNSKNETSHRQTPSPKGCYFNFDESRKPVSMEQDICHSDGTSSSTRDNFIRTSLFDPSIPQLKLVPNAKISPSPLFESSSTHYTNATTKQSRILPTTDSTTMSNFNQQVLLMTSSPSSHHSPSNNPLDDNKTSLTLSNTSSLLLSTSESKSSLMNSLGTRDPRLAVHQSQLICDVPPPPPPENFKLPLWVDTTAQFENITTSSVSITSNFHLPVSKTSFGNDVLSRHQSDCSLDERIRLLDMQLMKSEKARPAVDYSKFRIRRKVEVCSASQTPVTTTTTQCISGATLHSSISTCGMLNCNSRSDYTVHNSIVHHSTISDLVVSVHTSSPNSPSQTSALIKPADTSEFVKSMLSSSKPLLTSNDGLCTIPVMETMSNDRSSITMADPFFTRLPRVTTTSSNSSFIPSRPISNSTICNVEHSSLCGTQPVGVATRMPSLSMSYSSESSVKTCDDPVTQKPPPRNDSSANVEKCEQVVNANLKTTDSHQSNLNRTLTSISSTKVMANKTVHDRSKAIDECKSHQIDSIKLKSDKSNVQKSGVVKSLKREFPRHTLDDSVFDSKWTISSSAKLKRNKRSHIDGLDMKKKTQSLTSSKNISNISNSHSIKHKTEKSSIIKKEHSQLNKENVSKSDLKNQISSTRQLISLNVDKRKKLGSCKKRFIHDSDDSDWDPSSNVNQSELNVNRMSETTRYESMYDKIKRRASKGTNVCDDPKDRTDDLHASVKSHSKSKKNLSHKQFVEDDSDTDECFSDRDDHQSPIKSIKGRSTVQTKSGVSLNKRKKHVLPSSNDELMLVRGKSKKVQKERDCNSMGMLNSKRRLKSSGVENTVNQSRKARTKSFAAGCTPTKHEDSNSKVKSSQYKRNVKSVLSAKERQRSLVRRVFASNSSSLSFSSMSGTSSDDEVFTSDVIGQSKDKLTKSSSSLLTSSRLSSKSSSPRISRSCSPEDLDVDAAVRHTFGAFTAPFVTLKDESTRSNNHQTHFVNAKTKAADSDVDDYKPTPPTLPMTDSSISADQHSSGGLTSKSSMREQNDWNIFTSLAKQSTPKCEDKDSHGYRVLGNLAEEDADVNSNRDEMDELPSLEKHDEEYHLTYDECGNLYDSSILLHESASTNNCTASSNDFNDGEMSTVVSTINPQLSYSEIICPENQSSDIIEEIVYQDVELQVVNNETCTTIPNEVHAEQVIDDSVIKPEVEYMNESIVKVTDSQSGDVVSQSNLQFATAATDLSSLQASVSAVPSLQSMTSSVPISISKLEESLVGNWISQDYSMIQPPATVSQQHVTVVLPITSLCLNEPLILNKINTSECLNSRLTSQLPASIVAPISDTNNSNTQVGVQPQLKSSTNVSYDPSDFTSYVQRVIERVKQEKDEEVLHQREKVKRPKKGITNVSTLSTAGATSNLTMTTTSCTTSVVAIPGVNVCPKPISVVEETNLTSLTSNIYSQTKQSTQNCTFLDFNGPDSLQSRKLSVEDYHSSEKSLFNEASEDNKNVDEIIDSVASGNFDEKEYVQKLLKGVFCNNVPTSRNCTGSFSLHSPATQSEPHVFTHTMEEENLTKSDAVGSFDSLKPILNLKSSPSSLLMNTLSENVLSTSSTELLTPIHVLSLVASGAAPPNVQKLCTTNSMLLPNLSQPSSSLSHYPTDTLTTQSSTWTNDRIAEQPNAFFGAMSTTNPVNVEMENFAAQFANNPLTSYFYNLLTQKQLSPLLSPKSSSDPTENAPTPFPNLASSSGTNTDYLAAAAKMAAMAAMTGGSTQEINQITPTNFADAKSICGINQLHQNVLFDQLPLQDYPIIWRGRLSLKNEEVYVHMHYISGNHDLLKTCMGVIAEQYIALHSTVPNIDPTSSACYPLKIVQRMRLEASQLEGVQRKLRQMNDFCMCLTLATSPPHSLEGTLASEQIRMNQVLRDVFIKYMLDKSAAGIINVCHPCTQQNLFVIHIFPPCDFSQVQLQACAPNLAFSLSQSMVPHTLTVITTV